MQRCDLMAVLVVDLLVLGGLRLAACLCPFFNTAPNKKPARPFVIVTLFPTDLGLTRLNRLKMETAQPEGKSIAVAVDDLIKE